MSKIEPLGQRIRRLRTEQAMSQDRLALRAHVDQSGLSKLETGKVTMGAVPLTRIATALGMTLAELVEGTDFAERASGPSSGA